MAVIIDMDMPKKCIWDCPLCNGDGGGCQLEDVFTSDTGRPGDCPLKSTDDVVPMENINKMIAEMEQASYCDKETKMVKNCNASGLSVAIKIINKYCKENES